MKVKERRHSYNFLVKNIYAEVEQAEESTLINSVMGADINQDYFLFGDHHFKSDPVADIDRDTMQTGQFALEGMQPERGVAGIDFQKLQGFPVLADNLRAPLDELAGTSDIAFRVDYPIGHQLAFLCDPPHFQ